MKIYKLIINPFAEEDLVNSKQYFDEQREGLGNEFVSEVKKTAKRIEQNPNQFPKQNAQIHKANVDRFPFSIFFYIKDLIINVFAVFHTSRNPTTIKQRYKSTD